MDSVLQPITSCLKKADAVEDKNVATSSKNPDVKGSEITQPQGSLLWRMSSQAYNVGSGVIGIGVNGIKWAASSTYNVGSGVVSATQTVVSKVVPSAVPKPKKE